MKRYFSISVVSILSSICVCAILISGCSKETQDSGLPPVIKSVTYLTDRSNALNSVNYGEWILIKGANLRTTTMVEFNTVAASDSLVYADDTSITVKIPPTLPDPANNPITVTTKFGTATYQFKILQPAPIFSSFSVPAGQGGEVISLFGDYLNGVESVMFGATQATIVSETKTELKVEVPSGFTFGYITITTPSGSVTSEHVFGFQYVLFDEAVAPDWWSGPWGGSVEVSAEQVRRGANAIKYIPNGGWGGAKWGINSPYLDMNGYSGFKVSLYGGPGSDTRKIRISLNGVTSKSQEVKLKEGEWMDVQIPLYNLGNPTEIKTVTLQAFSSVKFDFYIDDVGFY